MPRRTAARRANPSDERRVAVCEMTFRLYARAPYADPFDRVEPLVAVPLDEARPFPCGVGTLLRGPRETKGEGYARTTDDPGGCCGGGC